VPSKIPNVTLCFPQTRSEALKRPDASKWETAMKEQYNSLMEMGTWKLVNLPHGQRAIKCKWVFTIKEDGQYKARLVAQGFTQTYGFDYKETFSPVARYESLRTILARAALDNWEIKTLDVKTAYLYRFLDEEIYMEQPEGFIEKGKEKQVCRLLRSIYGLKQSRRVWNDKIHKTLLDGGFKRTYSDTGVYVQ
jgi:hypothetical protein